MSQSNACIQGFIRVECGHVFSWYDQSEEWVSDYTAMRSAAGCYVGRYYYDEEMEMLAPYSRDTEYFATKQEALDWWNSTNGPDSDVDLEYELMEDIGWIDQVRREEDYIERSADWAQFAANGWR